MEFDRFTPCDIDEFLRLAETERWISDRWELEFLLKAFPQGCLVSRIRGFPVAFVTSIRHDRSGWIGNLVVHPDLRLRGIGGALMAQALSVLDDEGVETVWLTASPSGRPLYERLGFRERDTVLRWFGRCRVTPHPSCGGDTPGSLVSMDAAGWGDRREELMAALGAMGTVYARRDAFLVMRQVGPLLQVGPWTGISAHAAAGLFAAVIRPDQRETDICLDVPAANETAVQVLESSGFLPAGSSMLMSRGVLPDYRPDLVGALASMGSIG